MAKNSHGYSLLHIYISHCLMKISISLNSRTYFWYLCYLRQSWISIGSETQWDERLTQISPNLQKTYGNENVKVFWERMAEFLFSHLLSFSFKVLFISYYMYECWICMYLCTPWMVSSLKSEKHVRSPRTGVTTDDCESPCMCWELNPVPWKSNKDF